MLSEHCSPSKRHHIPRTKRGLNICVEKSARLVTITQGVPGGPEVINDSVLFLNNNQLVQPNPNENKKSVEKLPLPLSTVVTLKQGLHSGTGCPRSRWERPRVQRTVSGGSSGRRYWMRSREGRRSREEVNIVAFNWD